MNTEKDTGALGLSALQPTDTAASAPPAEPQVAAHALDRALASGIAWTALLRWSAQVLSWVGTFYAANILLPSDYGLVSMAMIAIGMMRMVEDFGMDAVLVQDARLVGTLRDRLAGFLVMLGVGICLLFGLLSLPIARFFREPQLAQIIPALSLLFILDALQVVPRAQLQRDLQFRRLGLVAMVQVLATQTILVLSAWAGFGYWSLVINTLGGQLVIVLLLCWWSPYRIGWPRQVSQLAIPLLQGWRILASRAAWYFYSNADQTIIGRLLGKDLLGAYSFATTLSTLTQQEVGAIVSKVVPGIFSQVQNSREELRRYFLLLTQFVTLLSFPLALGLALLADLVIPLVLGPRWRDVIEPLRLLCAYSMFYSSQLLVPHVLMWTGQFRVNMWCSIFAGVTMPVAFLVAAPHGLAGMGWAWALAYPVVSVPSLVFAFRTLKIGFMDWISALMPAVVACTLMAAAILSLNTAMPASVPAAARVGAAVVTGAVVYLAALWLAFPARVRELLAAAGHVRQQSMQVAS